MFCDARLSIRITLELFSFWLVTEFTILEYLLPLRITAVAANASGFPEGRGYFLSH